eukprot:TRINITY_DN3084_c0_g1_i1.p2 TRINITY_DN3084_c0_g1~~TRINITY_DN3084_c0_g1_i1.p2  ORF type:complete len:228 (+),score=46.14 TRINITY_DN3084_c0_g1_i1:163-846(+)
MDKVRILVLGDSGSGKTSLLHLICRGEPLPHISYTVGAAVDVKLHEFKEGTPQQKSYFIELIDVGGSHSHRNSRKVFYGVAHGIILVHDLTNKKSDQNLRKWLHEVMSWNNSADKYRESTWDTYDDKNEDVRDVSLPLLVLGTKLDLLNDPSSNPLPVHGHRRSDIAELYQTEEIHLNCNDPKSLVPGSSAANKLSRFYDKVISRQFAKRDLSLPGGGSISERRRWN